MLKRLGKPFPDDVQEQLWGAIGAVFEVEQPPRPDLSPPARHSRGLGNGCQCPGDGVRQSRRDESTGVAFTRDPATGEHSCSANFLSTRRARMSSRASARRNRSPNRSGTMGGEKPSMEEAMPDCYRRIQRIGECWNALPRHAGPGIHRSGRPALHAPDPLAANGRGAALKSLSTWWREGLIDKHKAFLQIGSSHGARPVFIRPSTGPAPDCIATGLAAPPEPRPAKSRSPRMKPKSSPPAAATSSWCGRRRAPKTFTACMRRVEYLRHEAE